MRGDAEGVKRAWAAVKYVFIPALVCDDHWVACKVDLAGRLISMYDSAPSGHSDREIDETLKPLCEHMECMMLGQNGMIHVAHLAI